MLGFAPISTRPISALPNNSLAVTVACDTVIEARLASPLYDLMTDPRKPLVLSAIITAVPLGA